MEDTIGKINLTYNKNRESTRLAGIAGNLPFTRHMLTCVIAFCTASQKNMKRVIIFLLLMLTRNVYGQEIELQGRYGASFIGGESINFVGKDSFYFGGFYCTWGVHGKGRCEIKDGYLYLYFEKSKTKPVAKTVRPAIITKSVSNDSISTIQLTVADYDGHSIPYATAELERSKNPRSGTITDTAGQALFRIKGKSSAITLRVSAIGMETANLTLAGGADYTIQVFLRQDPETEKELNNGEVSIYEIDDFAEDFISMRPKNSAGPFRKYRKKAE